MERDLTQYSTDELFSELMSRQDIPNCHVLKRVGSLFDPAHYEIATDEGRKFAEVLADSKFDRSRDFIALLLA